MMGLKSVICFLALFSLAYAKHEEYEGHSVYEVTVQNERDVEIMGILEEHLGLDMWSHPGPSRTAVILVGKEVKEEFEFKLNAAGIKFRVGVENIREFLELEDQLLAKSTGGRRANISRNGLPFDRTYTWDQIDAYLDILGEDYPNIVTVVHAGNSFEGRPIKYLKISTTNFQDTSKPIVYMQSLLHSREWITQAATLYAIHKLVIDVSVHEQDLLNNIDWIIMPVANPDGFHHTHDSARYWRKNRATGYMIGNFCMGVDLNRNFDIFWSSASSNNVCTDTFHGSRSFSEPETTIIKEILDQYAHRIELFLDIHSFGSWILFGYGNGIFPPNALTINLVGVQMAQAIDAVKVDYNPDYVVGNVALILYAASGSAMDYALSRGVPLTYTFELPGFRLGGSSLIGFLVDPDFIEQAGFETWEGIKVAARYVRSNYGGPRTV